MNRRTIVAAALVFLTALGASATTVIEARAQTKRAVFLAISWPGRTSPARLAAVEGDGATVNIPNVGQFRFTPTIKTDGKTVVVTISDASSQPVKELGKVEPIVGGKPASSKTRPVFDVQVESVK